MRARILPALALLALLALGRAAGAEEKVRLGYNANSARNIASLVLHVIERKALFANEGLAVELVGLPGTTAMVDALDNGTVDVTGTATPYLIQAVLKGSDAAAVIGGPANAVYSLMGKPEIKTAADLKDKIVAMSTPADTISLSTRLMLAKHGIEPHEYRTKELVGSNAQGQLSQRRRMRCRAARPARGHRPRAKGISQARQIRSKSCRSCSSTCSPRGARGRRSTGTR